MAVTCPQCRSDQTQSIVSLDQCLACGKRWKSGDPAKPPPKS